MRRRGERDRDASSGGVGTVCRFRGFSGLEGGLCAFMRIVKSLLLTATQPMSLDLRGSSAGAAGEPRNTSELHAASRTGRSGSEEGNTRKREPARRAASIKIESSIRG